MIERAIDFERLRGMRCVSCSYEWQADAEWLDLFHQGFETCPECGVDCRIEERPDFWVLPHDPSQDDSMVRDLYWYHTSTHSNWPDRTFDPAAGLTEKTKQKYLRLGTDGLALDRWVQRQQGKALHLGTYEASIENMLRRISDQDNADDQFHLYRVRLNPSAVVEPGVHKEPTNWVGDVHLSDLCSPCTNAFRYVNTHEDPSSVSLAVTVDAIQAVQGIRIPLAVVGTHPWITSAGARLMDAASLPAPRPVTTLDRLRRTAPSPVLDEARKLEVEVADTLPLGLRRRLHVKFDAENLALDPCEFPRKLLAMAALITDPLGVLELLEAEPWREV